MAFDGSPSLRRVVFLAFGADGRFVSPIKMSEVSTRISLMFVISTGCRRFHAKVRRGWIAVAQNSRLIQEASGKKNDGQITALS